MGFASERYLNGPLNRKPMKFCPKCGKKDIAGDFCNSCSAEILSTMLEFKEIVIKICPVCMSYFFQNRWVRFDEIAVVARKLAKENIKKRISAEINPILPDVEFAVGKKYSFEIEIALSKKEKYYLPARIVMMKCDKCGKINTNYFEGVLQLRNPRKDAVDFIMNDLKKQKDKGVFITDEKRAGNGTDYYMTSQRYLQNLGYKLQKVFGGILKINPRMFTRNKQTSKDVFRVNVYFELLDFGNDDVVKCGGKIIRITSTGKNISGVNLETGNRSSFHCKEDAVVLKTEKTEVIKVYPHIEVLNPETYQPLKIENKKKVSIGEHVDIIIDGSRAFIV